MVVQLNHQQAALVEIILEAVAVAELGQAVGAEPVDRE
jgi:hypothetical protein